MHPSLFKMFTACSRPILFRRFRVGVLSGVALIFALSVRAATVTVDTANDTLDGTTTSIAALIAAKGADGKISLREAIIAANNTAGADTVTFSSAINGSPIRLSRTGPSDANCVNGDLDINGSLTMIGNGTNNTIIQGASDYNSTTKVYTGSIGDKIIGINQDGLYTNLTVNISNLTIRWANNTNAFGASDFSYTGGGVDVYMTGYGNSISFSDCVITDNANANAYGGGVNIDSSFSGLGTDVTNGVANRGTVTFTRCTISNNRANPNKTGNDGSGGGICIFGDIQNVVLTDCVVAGNTTATNGVGVANGGGINVQHTKGGTVTITGGFVTNNSATGTGGGISVLGDQNLIMNGVTISNNTSVMANLGNALGGGLTLFSALGGPTAVTYAVTNCIISGNHADNGTDARGGGVCFGGLFGATLSGCTIDGNTADIGAGIANVGSTTNTSLTVDNCTINGNTANLRGGGIANVYLNGTSVATTTLTKSTISGNSAVNEGGGIYLTNGIITATFNRILNNTAPTGKAVAQVAATTASVANNWWGTNAPASLMSGTVNYTPWLMLNHNASPATIFLSGSTTLTATFLTNSAGTAISAANLSRMIGLPITFNNPVLGTLSGAQTTIQSSGSATATFTGNAVGAGSAGAVVDNQTTTAPISIATLVTSINRVQTTPTNLASVQWTVTFSNAVSGVTSGNFSLVNTGLGGSPSITGVTAVGGAPATAWTVTASTGSGSGTLGLTMANATSLSATVANLPFTGQVYTIDLVAPDTTITTPPPAITNNASVSFSFTGSDTGVGIASYQCQLDGAGYTNCTSPVIYSGLSETSHTFNVRAIDGVGNVDASPAASTWIVDTTPPSVTISSPSVSSTNGGAVNYSVTYADVHFNSSTLLAGNVTLNKTATADGTVLVSGSGTSRTVTVTNISGDGTLGISIAAGTATDTASNSAPAAGPSSTFTVLSTKAALANLTLSSGALTPAFNGNVVSYTNTVTSSTTQVSVTPTSAQANATIQVRINGGIYNSVVSGTPSSQMALIYGGTNLIDVKVTAHDGLATKTYTLTVIQVLASNTSVASVTADANLIAQVGGNYSWTVPSSSNTTSVTVVAGDTNASVQFDSDLFVPATATKSLSVSAFGLNTHTLTVKAENGALLSYQLRITRPLSTNANLSSLTLTSGSLVPTFSPSVYGYNATVGGTVSNVFVTGIAADANALIKFNGGSYLTGTNSTNAALVVGTNSVSVIVLAQDGVQQATNVLSIIRSGPPLITGIARQTNGNYFLQFSGGAGVSYALQSSTNLPTWNPLTNLTAGTNGLFNFNDNLATNYPVRFYRLSDPL